MSIKRAIAKLKPARSLTLLSHPDTRLSQKSAEIDLECEAELVELDQLIANLIATMRKEKGAGLAAIQAGIPKRVFVYDTGDKEESVAALINPRIVSLSDELVEDEEGCLSFPALYAQVKRSKSVVVEGYNQDREKVSIEAEGFLARVFQHEIDHLDGLTFIEHLSEEDKKLALREYFDLRM